MRNVETRNIAVAILLTLVTCGIYGIIWAVKMVKDAVNFADESDEGTVEILLAIFFPAVGFFLAERKFAAGCEKAGIAHEDKSMMYLILGLFGLGIVDFVLMQSDLNKIAEVQGGNATVE